MAKIKTVLCLLTALVGFMHQCALANTVDASINISGSNVITVSPDSTAYPAQFLAEIDKSGGTIRLQIKNNYTAFTGSWQLFCFSSNDSSASYLASDSQSVPSGTTTTISVLVPSNPSSSKRTVQLTFSKGTSFSKIFTGSQKGVAVASYTVTYEPGVYSSGSSVSDTKQAGVQLTLRDALFTRTGYTQEGWSTSTYGTSKTYSLRGTYTADASTTLYPYWVGKSSTVTLDKQGGTGGTTSKTATYGSAMPSITPPTRDGYVFGGYYSGTNGSGTKYYNADGSSAHNCDFTSAKTLYAKWTQHVATKYGLFVGINEYDTEAWHALGWQLGTLKGCVVDALSMNMICTDYGSWSANNIVILTNKFATLSRFRQEISSLAARALPGDTVLIYDSGHGGTDVDNSKNTFICAYDDAYRDSTFASDIANFSSGVKVVVMLDTCLSAGMFKSLSKGAKPSDDFANAFISNVSAAIDSTATKSVGSKGISSSEIGWIAAADYNIESQEVPPRGGMGLFTGFMIVDSGVLAGRADLNGDRKITCKELYEHSVALSIQYSCDQIAQAANTTVLDSVGFDDRHISLETALDNNDVSFSTYNVCMMRDGPPSWVGQNLSNGSYARTAVLPNAYEAATWFTALGAGDISFRWKVSSEANYDKLSFIVDGITNAVISGETDWVTQTCSVGAGQHEFAWSYGKDGSISKGADCAWLDQVVWTPTQTYTVYYKPGSNGSGSQKTATKTHGVTLTLLGETFTREGYKQTGWATTDGGSQAYALNAAYTANAGVTLYPVWTPNTYTITYKPGSNGSGSQKTATKTHDVPLTLLGETFTRDGYTQTGWAATDGGAQVYPLNGVYTANAAATFYPVWTPIAKPQPTSEEIASALDCDYIDFVQEVSSSGTPYWMPETGNGYTGGETLRVEGLASNHWSSVITSVQGPCVVGWEWGCAKNDSECLLRMFADGDYQNPIGATNDGKWHMCYWEFADGECHTLDCCFAQGRLNSSGEGGLALYDTMAVYYQVSFDSNGGNGSAIAENGCVTKDNGDGTTNRYYEVGTSLTLPSGEGVTRGGFTFEGWTVDGDDTVYAPGDTYPVEMSPIVFKAKWAVAQTYIVTYSPGANGVGSQKTVVKTHGITLRLFGATFTRTGYTQTGWATADGGAQAYALGAEYDANAALTLYPVWTPNTYTITYKPGSNGSGSQKTATKTHDVPLTLLGETFTRDGYTQTGWAATDGGAQVYPLNGVYTANAVATFYPVWTAEAMPPPAPEEIADALDCCLLDFYAEVSTDGVGYWRPSGANMIISGLASDQWSSVMATANGPCFVDWNWACVSNNSECGLFLFVDNQVVDKARSSTGEHGYRYIGDGEHTLDWCFIQSVIPTGSQGGLAGLNAVGVYYPITYDLNGAEGSLPIPPEWCYRHVDESGHTNFFFAVGGEVSLLSASGLSKPGYSFVGWECSLNGEVYEAGEGYVVPDEPTVFTAKWEAAQTYTVTYRPGAIGVGSQKTSVKTHGVALQLLGATFTRTGYTQTGWATTDGGAQAYALNAMYAANAAMTLYPVWTANTFTVAFSANGGDGSMEVQPFTYDVAQNLRLNAFTRSGYEFVGWARMPNAEAAEFEDGESVENLAEEDGSSLTLYAVWEESAPPVVDPKPDWKEQIVVMPYKQSVFVRIYDVTTKSYLEHAEGMLAAFAANGECRGCTTLLNGPVCKLFQLSVGIESETEKGFTLKYWNPQTGVIDVREGFDANANKKIGAINAPETYHVGEIEFELTMKSGWNWISIPVKPSDISIGSVFGGFAFSDEDSIMSADGTATYYAGQWYSGDFDAIVPGAGYCVHKGTAGSQVVTVSGEAIANSAAVRSGWNWIGCPSVSEIGLSDVSHSAGFADEDEINSADGIAVCYSGTWYSSDFDVLEPGAAYIAKLARSGTVTFGGAKAMSSRNAGIKSCLSSSKSVGAAPTWKEEIVIQPESLSLFCKIKKGDAGELIETEGSMLGVFAANGECRGATTILTVPNVGTFFQLKVGAENALESGFTLKVWDASTGKTYDVDGSFGFGDCTGDKKIGSFTSPVTKIAVVAQPIPPLPVNPTADDVKNALDGSADAHLQECITEPTVYNAYRAWAETVKAPGGSTAAGAQTVKDSPNAWLSFALDSETLIQTPPADGDVKVEKFEQTATAGSFDFTVGVENIPVGDDAKPGNLAKVFGIEGGSTLSPQDMSADKVDITFGTPENGKVKFTAGPKDKTQPTFFMKVKVK